MDNQPRRVRQLEDTWGNVYDAKDYKKGHVLTIAEDRRCDLADVTYKRVEGDLWQFVKEETSDDIERADKSE